MKRKKAVCCEDVGLLVDLSPYKRSEQFIKNCFHFLSLLKVFDSLRDHKSSFLSIKLQEKAKHERLLNTDLGEEVIKSTEKGSIKIRFL